MHSIDKDAPEIRFVHPNIMVDKEIRDDSLNFMIGVYDKYSGVDIRRCRIRLQNINAQIIDSSSYNSEISDSLIKIDFLKKPACGQYNILITLGDRAGNICQKAYSFIIREKEDLQFRASCKPIKEPDKQKIIDAIVTPYKTFVKEGLEYSDLYLFDVYIGNGTHNAFIKNLYFSLDMGLVIYSCDNTGSFQAKDVESILFSEAYDKSLPKGQIHCSVRDFSISELAPPYGMAKFSIVCGRTNYPWKDELPLALRVDGNYIFEGYGIHQAYEIYKNITIEY